MHPQDRCVETEAPYYSWLCFWDYSRRLQGILQDNLIGRMQDELKKCPIRAAWIALAAPAELGKRGFAAGPTWFPADVKVPAPSGEPNEFGVWPRDTLLDAARATPAAGIEWDLSRLFWESMKTSFLNSHLAEGNTDLATVGKRLEECFPDDHHWRADISGQLTAAGAYPKKVSVRKVIENTVQGTQTFDGHPRDIVLATGAAVVVGHFSVSPSLHEFPDGQEVATVAWAWRRDMQGLIAFAQDIDLAARVVLESIQHHEARHDTSDACLALVPLSTDDQAGSIEAVLALVIALPRPWARAVFPGHAPDAGRQFRANDRDSLRQSLIEVGGIVQREGDFMRAVEVLREAFRCRPERMDDVLTEFDRRELQAKVTLGDGNASVSPECAQLQRLYGRIDAAKRSPVKFALDAFCDDIIGAMQAMTRDLNPRWERLVAPLVDFAQQERLLLGRQEQRGHYIHTLKVFLLGRRLLDKAGLWTDPFFAPRWILASFFHDVCYPIQRTDEWLDAYLSRLSPRGVKARITTDDFLGDWDNRGYAKCWFDVFLRLVDKRLRDWLMVQGAASGVRFQANALYNLLRRNHALLGAAALLDKVREEREWALAAEPLQFLWELDDVAGSADENLTERRQRISVIFDAATAIALHDPAVWTSLPSKAFHLQPWKDHATRHTDKVAYLAWALACTDAIQEWGRETGSSEGWVSRGARDPSWRVPWWVGFQPPDSPTLQLCYPAGFQAKLHERRREGVRVLRSYGKKVLEGKEISVSERQNNVQAILEDIACLWEVIADPCDVELPEWQSAARHLGLRGQVAEAIKAGKAPGGVNSLAEWGRRLRVLLGSEAAIPPADKAVMDDLKRVHGFWRIPKAAAEFWGAPPGLGLVVKRVVASPGADGMPRQETEIDTIEPRS